jgi:endonuclease YncB( thermonuclease family)
MKRRFLRMLLLALLPMCYAAEPTPPVLVGIVTRVTDGDTIHVQLSSGDIIVRLDSIDAPEHDQPGGREATQALTALVLGHAVSLEVITQDRYERLVAQVLLNGESVNARLVREGHAWAYRFFVKNPDYCRWEDEARSAHRGLWEAAPASWVYPSDWRRLQSHKIDKTEDFSVETAAHCVAGIGKR